MSGTCECEVGESVALARAESAYIGGAVGQQTSKKRVWIAANSFGVVEGRIKPRAVDNRERGEGDFAEAEDLRQPILPRTEETSKLN